MREALLVVEELVDDGQWSVESTAEIGQTRIEALRADSLEDEVDIELAHQGHERPIEVVGRHPVAQRIDRDDS